MKKSFRYTLLVLILAAIGYAVYWFLHQNPGNTVVYKNLGTNKAVATDPYAGWRPYSSLDGKLSFKYPGDWVATDGRNSGVVAYATSGDFTAGSAGVSASSTDPEVLLRVQVGTYSGNNFCSSISCQVVAIAPVSGAPFNNDVLAVINETFPTKKITVYAVTGSNIRVGSSAVEMASVGNSQSVSGQLEYSSPSTANALTSPYVTDASSFQSSAAFKNLVLLINSIKFGV